MKPATNTLTEIFNSDVRYVVPLYQRPYVWRRDTHWEPLWEDITVVLEHYLNGDGSVATHFLGAIVLDQEDNVPGEAIRRLVIDGQQRLTTLQLLLKASTACADGDGADRQARLLKKLIWNDADLASGDARFKVWPTNANQSAFRAVMHANGAEPEGPDDPSNTIHEAYAYFRGVITAWVHDGITDEDELGERYEALRVALSSLLLVVTINLEAGDNAQLIFETLNARGTPLLAMDLVKNAVFYRADKEGVDVDQLHHEVWEPQLGQDYWREERRQGRLTRPRAELFLMHWLAMKLGRIVPATELFSQFRTYVLDSPQKPAMADLIPELTRDADVLRGFDSQPPGSVEERFFRHLDVLDTTTVIPLALLLYRSDEVSIDQRRRGLQAIESWLVRRMLCGLTTRGYNRLAADLLAVLKQNLEQADEEVVKFLRSSVAGSARWPTDEELTNALTGRDLYGWVAQRRVVMVLADVELHLRESNKVEDIYTLPSNLTIEHVLPQTWEENWPLPDLGPDASEVRQAHIHRLGNLTLTSGPLNSSLSNAAWSAKREALLNNSLLRLNQQVCAHDEWDEAIIDARGTELTQTITRLWPGPDASIWGVPIAAPAPATAPAAAEVSEEADGNGTPIASDRVALATRIAQARARGDQWSTIGERENLSGSQLRRLANFAKAERVPGYEAL